MPLQKISIHQINIHQAVEVLKSGDILIFPTETSYGIAADATNATAIEKVYALKERDPSQPLSILVDSLEMLESYIDELPNHIRDFVQEKWPGPTTILFPMTQGQLPGKLNAGLEELAVRISSHPIAQELVLKFGKPITATSANPSDLAPAYSIFELERYFGQNKASDLVPYLSAGDLEKNKNSEIVRVKYDLSLEYLRR